MKGQSEESYFVGQLCSASLKHWFTHEKHVHTSGLNFLYFNYWKNYV